MQVLLAACGAAHLGHIARALQPRDALAGLWVSNRNRWGIAPDKFRRSRVFHLAMTPFYYTCSVGAIERIYHSMFPIWRFWLRRQPPPHFDAVHCIPGY